MSIKKTLVLGVSENPNRYAYKAVQSLLAHGHPVIAIGRQEKIISSIPIGVVTDFPKGEAGIHTITLYINPQIQSLYYPQILALSPQRVIFNPGTENAPFEKLLEEHQIKTVRACTLVLLSLGQY